MIFWTREIAGWLLIALGLAAFTWIFELSEEGRFLQLIPTTIVGIFLFRGGIHLLKVAVAARICREAQQRLYPDAATGSAPLPTARSQVRAGWRA
jgi:hypothetical protein